MKILYRLMRTLGKTGRCLFEEAILACTFASVVSAYAVDILLGFVGETSWDWYKITIPSLNLTGLYVLPHYLLATCILTFHPLKVLDCVYWRQPSSRDRVHGNAKPKHTGLR